ncbi:LacI family DNA-binding transcriptional regulator [Cellulomonas denverensis]|uniref:LacI family transcriptional regulator n=1 Tax=Cellulomonas denverensis TaxID=264297 RepID=A0A7X6KXW2_9CELL|nr:LacI family DNA-binding transcriptional regulator [Cellulomonas denverensis]NKY24196.1 LacI family transcriptional regulator [Cellulomonas denverensis]GIG25374.1 LacI family transcriptional regulator [Cellulomonas denverensis]
MAVGSAADGRPARLADVARLAGVSPATASKALNNREQVRAETRERVVSAAEALGFRPHNSARHLASGRSRTIGLITHDLEGRFSIPILMGAEDVAGTGDVSVLLCDARGDSIREQHHLHTLLSRRVDGLIVVGARTDPRPSLGALPVPVVYAYAPSEDPQDTSVVTDDLAGGRMAVEHLLALGRSRIGIVAGDIDFLAARQRVDGAMRALTEAGLEPVGGTALYGAWTEEWGRIAAASILGRHPEVDALVCGSDLIARGALETARERGRAVPQEIAVLGHDNWGLISDGARPRLSSIDLNLEELGRRAAALLFGAIDGDPRPRTTTIPSRLVPRGSTAG